MATTNVQLTSTWTLMVTGPTSIIGTVSAHIQDAEFAVGSSAPAADTHGFKSHPSDPYCFELNVGENLYGRAASPAEAAFVILNT